jgi:protein-tyrosine kinase
MQLIQAKVMGDRSIGAILVDHGKLAPIDAEKILREQKLSRLRFGDAGLKLGLLSESDIQFALARQFDYPYLVPGDQTVAEEIVAAFKPFSPFVEELRALRTQLMLRWFGTSDVRKGLAIVSPAQGDGRSFIAANLAVVFSQLGERTLLIDADLRNPRQHLLFKMPNGAGLSAVLSGRVAPEQAVHRVDSLLGLSVLPAGATPPNPQELLSRDIFSSTLQKYGETFDVILVDTPPAVQSADAQTVAARAGAALLVARNHQTAVATLQELAGKLQNSNVALVGAMLNGV